MHLRRVSCKDLTGGRPLYSLREEACGSACPRGPRALLELGASPQSVVPQSTVPPSREPPALRHAGHSDTGCSVRPWIPGPWAWAPADCGHDALERLVTLTLPWSALQASWAGPMTVLGCLGRAPTPAPPAASPSWFQCLCSSARLRLLQGTVSCSQGSCGRRGCVSPLWVSIREARDSAPATRSLEAPWPPGEEAAAPWFLPRVWNRESGGVNPAPRRQALCSGG